jgi:membrane protein
MGFAVCIGAELNNAIQEQWPAPDTHARRLRWWLKARSDELTGNGQGEDRTASAADPVRPS